MTEKQVKQRQGAYHLSAGVCAVCGKPLSSEQLQYAHAIGNTKTNREKYGSFFVDSVFNGCLVCSLECNTKIDVGKSQGKILDKLADILIKEIKNFKKK